MKISTKAKVISTALVAAVLAAPIAFGGSGTYPQLRTGEGFSFKAPSYWSSAQSTAVLATPGNAMNRSLGVPPRYQLHQIEATTAASTQRRVDPLAVGGPAYSLGPGYMQYIEKTGWFSPDLMRQREQIPAAFGGAAHGPAYSLGPGYLQHTTKTGWFDSDLVSQRQQIPTAFATTQAALSVHSAAAIRSGGFDWGDASVGAGAMLGILLLIGGMGAGVVTSRQNRRREVAGA
jgi:hypothetical protein